MVKINNPPRPRRSAAEVMTEVSERLPHLEKHMFMDRDWIWVCNINLSGAQNKDTRETLKEIGFRFSMKGHVMQDGATVGTWSHSCNVQHKGRGQEESTQQPSRDAEAQPDIAKMFTDLGL